MTKTVQNMIQKRLKIAMLGFRSIGPGISGGVERHVEEISTRMAAAGHEVTAFCRTRYNPQGERTYKGVRLQNCGAIYSKHFETITNTIAVLPHVLFGYDIVHFHAVGPSLFSWLPRLFQRKVITTIHGLDFKRAKWGNFAALVLKIGTWAAIHCPHKAIVVSPVMKKYFRERYNMRTYYIPNGVSARPNRTLDKLKRFHLTADKYLLSLGRLVPEKGLHYLVEAFRGLETDYKLVISGGSLLDNAYEQSLRRMARDDQRIIFTGSLYDEEKDEAYSNASAFVLSSDIEGMPITMLEAMSYGCPVLVSDIPECMEIYSEASAKGLDKIGLSFKAADIGDLREKINSMLTDSQRKEMGQRGRQFVLSSYNWDNIAEQTLQVYNCALSADARG